MRHLVVTILLLFICTGCIDFKGAADPFSYTPRTSHTVWRPPNEPQVLDGCLQEDFEFLENVEPLSLGEVLDLGLLNSPTTKATWARARMSAAEYGQTLQPDFLQIQGDASYTRQRNAIFVLGQREVIFQTVGTGDLNFNYIFLDFGQTRYSSLAALESLYNADWLHNRAIQAVIQRLMVDYYDYLYQQERLIAAEADVNNAQTTLDAVMAKLVNGMADISDKVQAVTSLKQTQLALVEQRQKLHNSYTKLMADMGVPANLDVKFIRFPKKITHFEPGKLNELILTALKHRPDLQAAESDVKAGEDAVTAAKRLFFPVIDGAADIGRAYFDMNRNDGYHWKVAASLNLPLFQGFYIANTVRLAESALDEAKARFEERKLNVLQDVVNFRDDVLLANEATTYAYEFLLAAEEEYRVLLDKYKVGTTTIVDVIKAQTDVADAQARNAEAQRDWYVSIADLAYGTGMLSLESAGEIFEENYEKK
ncbi:MAG: TolC family protein [Candidatus Algichlamydia australiensis]|nr:TolC family protein [Chlamydiales bacterium]